MIKSLIYSLFLTIVIELTTSILQGVRTKKDIAIIILTNSITNPIVVYIANVMMIFGSTWMYWILVIIMEISVVFIEGAIYSKTLDYDKKSGYKLSLINNFISFTIGLLVQLLCSIII